MEKPKNKFINRNKKPVKWARFYSEKFKLKVVEEVLVGKYSKEEARRVYGIKSIAQ